MKTPGTPKMIPDPAAYDIIPPDMNYRYFERPGRARPDFRSRRFSLANAWWFSECAFLAYTHPGFARLAFAAAGFENFRFFQGKGTECMAAWNRKAVILAFRGTELKSRSTLHEIRTDLDTLPVAFDRGGRVHRGFLQGLEEIWAGPDNLEAFLDELKARRPKRPLWLCGHSLGGALATLCFARRGEAAGLYVYGSPRVGDEDFVRLLEGRPLWRVEHGRDPVPLVPPDLPAIGFSFKDPGQLVFLSRKGEVLFQRPPFSLEEQKRKMGETRGEQEHRRREISRSWTDLFKKDRQKELLERIDSHLQLTREEWKQHLKELNEGMGLIADDHQPVYYATLLWNALVRP